MRSIIVVSAAAVSYTHLDVYKRQLDTPRIDYLREHVRWCQCAVDEDIPLIGYFVWSFIDLLSWLNGYQKQYGFVYVDHARDLQRAKKQSYCWYQRVIQTNGAML